MKPFSARAIIIRNQFPEVIIMSVKKLRNGEEIDKSLNAVNYSELTVKRKTPASAVLLKVLVALVFALGVFFFFVKVWWLGSLGLLIFIPAAVIIFGLFDTEFYYETASGEFTVYEKHGILKKKPFSVRYSAMTEIAPLTPEAEEKYLSFSEYEVLDFTSHKPEGENYYAVWETDGKKTAMKFQISEALLKIIKYYNRSALH